MLDRADRRVDGEVAELGVDHRACALGFGVRAGVHEDFVVVGRDRESPFRKLLRELGGLVAQLEAEALEEAGGVLLLELDADAPVVGHQAGILPYSTSVDPTTRSETPVWSRCFVIPPRKNG